jgi:phosphoribosylanthranilate isomerase
VLILQLHPEVLSAANGDAVYLLGYIENYVSAGAITHVLYDPSAGQGVGFDPKLAIATTGQIRQAFPELQLGVAGGLSPENVREKLEAVWQFDPDICIDVEGRVRNANDLLELDRAITYAKAALQLGAELAATQER